MESELYLKTNNSKLLGEETKKILTSVRRWPSWRSMNWFYLSFCTLSGAKCRKQSNPNCEHYCTDFKTNAHLWSSDTV